MEWLWYISYFVVLIGLSGYGIHRLLILGLYLKHSRKRPEPQSEFTDLPMVTVQLPCFNELHVMERLLDSVSALDYPKDKLQIQVLDDSTDETTDICKIEVAELIERGFDAEYVHRTDRTGYKAGALENGTETAKGELLFILDADFVPNPDVLQKTIHYFTDSKVGMIQTRWEHINRTFNTLTRVQAMFLDGHFELEQTARNRSGRFFTFNGTAGVWRKSCITDAGGWEHDTLTEDMDLSYRAQLKGWKFIFLNDVTTPAELPIDMEGFKSQQHRWTKGSIQVCKKILIDVWKSDAPFYCKMEATAHLTSNFAYLLLFLLCFLIYPKQSSEFSWLADHGISEQVLNLPIFFFGSVSATMFYMMSQKALRPNTWMKDILYFPLLLALGIGMSVNNAKAVIEAIFNHETAFIRTPKYGSAALKKEKKPAWKSSRYKAIKSLTPVIELAFALFFTVVVVDNALNANWVATVLLSPFPVGFFYTSLSSISQQLPGLLAKRSADKN
ncbi:MAG: cellulose synthase family protein [Akkermansiaceae bacterium]